jgi:hypothetical protein
MGGAWSTVVVGEAVREVFNTRPRACAPMEEFGGVVVGEWWGCVGVGGCACRGGRLCVRRRAVGGCVEGETQGMGLMGEVGVGWGYGGVYGVS